MAAITSGNVGKSLCIGLSWTEIRITKLFWFESPFMWIWRRTVYNLILFLLSSFPPILSGLLGLKCIYRKSIYNTQRNIVLAWESISCLNCFRNAILYNFYTFFTNATQTFSQSWNMSLKKDRLYVPALC